MTGEAVGSALLLEALSQRSQWRISARSFDVLIRMCATAVDQQEGDQPGRLYFGGWVPLSMMLGYEPPPDGEPMGQNAQQAVWRAVTELRVARLIEPLTDDRQRDDRQRAYLMTLADHDDRSHAVR